MIIGCSSKSIWVIKLSFCQNNSLLGESFWQPGHSYTFWTVPIMICSPVYFFSRQTLRYFTVFQFWYDIYYFSADIKRQEHIYEFILTESNHCQVLKVIQKIFVEGMFKYLSLSKDIVDRIFPQIDTLIDLHFRFLEELRARQNQVKLTQTFVEIPTTFSFLLFIETKRRLLYF